MTLQAYVTTLLAMGNLTKFSSQIEADVLDELRAYSKAEGRTLSSVLTEAAKLLLARVRVRPAFHDAATDVMNENDELLRRLAK